jgi:RNA polymerase sigma factor (sigma-70 family)
MASSPMSEVIQHLRRTALMPGGAELTDGQLLGDYLRGRDESALEALVCRHGPMVWGVCRRVLGNHHDAEDAFQATFLVFVRKAASIASRELLANWLYGVAYQTALKARATAAKRMERERQVPGMADPAAPEHGHWHDLRPLLDEALSRLPDKYRAVIVLCSLEGKNRKEAAQQLGVPEGTVGGWLARARALLAKRLARHGVAVSGGVVATMLGQNAASAGVPASVVSSTVTAASYFTAGQAAAPGAISIKVAVLTEAMLRTMQATRLKIATAVLFAASVVALTCGVLAAQRQLELRDDVQPQSQLKAAEPRNVDADKLQGAWRLVSAETDGLRFGAGRQEVKDTRIVFEKTSFTLFGKEISNDPRVFKEPVAVDIKYAGAYTLEFKQTPQVIVLEWKGSPWHGKKDFTQKAIYAIDGDTLRLCLNLPYEEKQVLPMDFSANAGSKRCLWTFKRDAETEKTGEKQQQPPPRDDVAPKAQIKPAQTHKGDKDRLQGTWRMVTAENDGIRNGEGRPEIKDNRLVIDESTFTVSYAVNFTLNGNTLELQKAEITTSAGTFMLDARQSPKLIVLRWKKCPWNGKKNFTQKAIYALDDDTLKLCLNVDGEEKIPLTQFFADAGSKQCLWTFKREPSSKKEGATKP